MINRVAKILDFFRAGYPEGIRKTDHFAALAALNAIAGEREMIGVTSELAGP
jgi:hypothetical protein